MCCILIGSVEQSRSVARRQVHSWVHHMPQQPPYGNVQAPLLAHVHAAPANRNKQPFTSGHEWLYELVLGSVGHPPGNVVSDLAKRRSDGRAHNYHIRHGSRDVSHLTLQDIVALA